jgi:hypothetical protein
MLYSERKRREERKEGRSEERSEEKKRKEKSVLFRFSVYMLIVTLTSS